MSTLTKTIVPSTATTVTPGSNIVYNITVTNNTVAGILFDLNDFIPVNTSFVSIIQISGPNVHSAIAPQVFVGSSGLVEVFSSIALAIGASVTFQLTLKVNPSIPIGTVISNTVSDTVGGGTATAPNITVVAPPVVAPSADLSVLTLGPQFTFSDLPTSFLTTVTNNGPDTASNVILAQDINHSCKFSLVQISGPLFNIALTTAIISSFPANSVAVFQTLVCPKPDSERLSVRSNVSSTTSDPNLSNNVSIATTIVKRSKKEHEHDSSTVSKSKK
jgi:hypothetical protein